MKKCILFFVLFYCCRSLCFPVDSSMALNNPSLSNSSPIAGTCDVSPDPIFTNDMVLQRDEKVRIYGSGSIEGNTVTVSFGEQTKTAIVSKGVWEVWLDPMKASTQGQILAIKGKETLVFKNILVGDVWVLGGQSNMMIGFKHIPKLSPIIKVADQPLIRVSYVDWPGQTPRETGVPQEIREIPVMRHSKWYPCVYQGSDTENKAMLDEFSTCGYFFATNLVAHTKVPVGLIMACKGATKAQWWMPMNTLTQHPELQSYLDEKDPNTSYLFNSVIHPIRKFSIRGVLWYQGEADNPLPEEYGLLFPRLIQSWREAWGTDIPFIFASLSSYAWPTDSWAYLRESQTKGLSQPKTGMIMTYDIGDYADIHPTDKQTVGFRFYMKAREVAYGEKIITSGPRYERLTISRRKAIIHFTNTGRGLTCRGISMPKNKEKTEYFTISSNRLEGFTICGPDRVFYPAEAVIRGASTIVVRSEKVIRPVAVRYGWATFALANLFNREGFPAEVFRTDTFPVPRFTPRPAPSSGRNTDISDKPVFGGTLVIPTKIPEASICTIVQPSGNDGQNDACNFSMKYSTMPEKKPDRGKLPLSRISLTPLTKDRTFSVFTMIRQPRQSFWVKQLLKSAYFAWGPSIILMKG